MNTAKHVWHAYPWVVVLLWRATSRSAAATDGRRRARPVTAATGRVHRTNRAVTDGRV